MNGLLRVILLKAQKEKRRAVEQNLSLLREYLSNHEQNVGGNMGSKGHSDEIADANEEHVIGQWREVHP